MITNLKEFLKFLEDNYYFNSGSWCSSETDQPIKRETLIMEYLKSVVNG